MKDHEIRELVNKATKTARKYQGCDCMRDALAHVLVAPMKADQEEIKRLQEENANLIELVKSSSKPYESYPEKGIVEITPTTGSYLW